MKTPGVFDNLLLVNGVVYLDLFELWLGPFFFQLWEKLVISFLVIPMALEIQLSSLMALVIARCELCPKHRICNQFNKCDARTIISGKAHLFAFL